MIMKIVFVRGPDVYPAYFKVLHVPGYTSGPLADTIFIIIVSRWQDLPFPL